MLHSATTEYLLVEPAQTKVMMTTNYVFVDTRFYIFHQEEESLLHDEYVTSDEIAMTH